MDDWRGVRAANSLTEESVARRGRSLDVKGRKARAPELRRFQVGRAVGAVNLREGQGIAVFGEARGGRGLPVELPPVRRRTVQSRMRG